MPEGHQGPPPEQQSGPQMHDPPASGKGTDDASNKEQTNKSALDVRPAFESNHMATNSTNTSIEPNIKSQT
jgi:hypothetical protein